MDATRIHLLITHLPLFGLFIGWLVLIYGLIRREKQVKIVSLLIFIIATVGAVISYQSGESAEDKVEDITGISEDAIEEHEESAEATIALFYGLGILSCVGLFMQAKEKKYTKELLLILLFAGAITFYFVARTASLGGVIRHTEIIDANKPG